MHRKFKCIQEKFRELAIFKKKKIRQGKQDPSKIGISALTCAEKLKISIS